MKKKLIVLFLLSLIVVGAYYYWNQQQSPISDDDLALYGNIDIREAQLAFNSNEHISKIFVEEGEHVKKGQLLASLHSELVTAQLNEAKALLEAQRQIVAKLEAGSRKQEIKKVIAELKAAQSQATAANETYHRLRALLNKHYTTPDKVDAAKAAADSANDNIEAIKQTLNLLKSGTRKEDIASARAVLASRKARVALAQQRLDDTHLYAPEDGVIRNRILEPGDMAFPQTPVMSLAFSSPVWVRAYLPEPALGKIALGAKAKIYTDSYPNKAYDGWIGYISPTAEFTPKNIQTEELRTRLVYPVRIFACNPQDELRLGMPVTVHIDTSQAPASQISGIQSCGQK